MPEGPDGKTIIIVKKVSGHGGHHGGAWKVAYADFVTAMMALFMVLWLVNSAAEPTRQRIASYFRKPGVFQKGSGTPLELGGAGILPDTFAPPADENSQLIVDKKIYEVNAETGTVREYFDQTEGKGGEQGRQHIEAEGLEPGAKKQAAEQERAEVRELVEKLEEAIRNQTVNEGGLLGKIDIKVDQRGLLIEIMDTDQASMFQVGSSEIVGPAEAQLLKIADILAQLPNPVDIEGHTDGRPFRGPQANRYDNWNLSSDRANAARRVLEKAGMKREQIARVVGYADQRLKVRDDALDPSNRRITIAMRFTEQANEALKGTRTIQTKPKPIALKEEPAAAVPAAVAGAAGQEASAATGSTAPAAASSAASPAASSAAAEARPEQPAAESSPPNKTLRVEVQTTLPEGSIIVEEAVEQPPLRPAEEVKDKIFGKDNPFFK